VESKKSLLLLVDGNALVSPKIKVYYPRPGGSFSDSMLYDAEAVKHRYGVDPLHIADINAL
jgi:DNA polymerase-1